VKIMRYVVFLLFSALLSAQSTVWVTLPPIDEWAEFLQTGKYPSEPPPELCCGDQKRWGWTQNNKGLWKLAALKASTENTTDRLLQISNPGPLFTFVGQSSCIPGLEQYAVVAQNNGDSSMTIRASDVMVQAKAQGGIDMATYTSVLRAIEEANSRSAWRYIGIGLEIGGYVVATLSAGNLIKIRES